MLSGKGSYSHPNMETYQGMFKDGVFDGHGTYTFPSGDYFVGEYKEG